MTWPPPTARVMLALHLAAGLPLLVLAIWFGAFDEVPLGEGRCASCGVEGYVIAAHVVAAIWLGVVVAATAAARNGGAGPGPRTLAGLSAVALFTAAALLRHQLLDLPALAAMVVSVALAPVAAVWWIVRTAAWLRRPPRPEALTISLAAAWIALAILLPAHLGWVWADRVNWLVF